MSEIKTDPDWDEWKLPDECPECGEEVQLAAMTEDTAEDGRPLSAEVMCYECNHDWDWEAGTEGGE